MNHDLADRWRARLPRLQAQLAESPQDLGAWHWRAEIRVLRFLINRYGQLESPQPQASAEVCIEPAIDEPTLLHMSALQRALVKMALLSPRVQTKHPRPTQRDRAAMLERLKEAGDEARSCDEADLLLPGALQWLDRCNKAEQARHDARRERDKKWAQIHRARAWEARERERRE